MTTHGNTSKLTDPQYCIEQAQRLLIPLTEDNWDLVKDEADMLNLLQAALVHHIYLDGGRERFQEQVLQTVFSAYLLGRTANERTRAALPEAFLELIEGLDLSGLTG